ncbi:unnamed protein product [Vicia faba]|uniref:Uncharacterized protein n=1 Tax=Vicia faba TaxID=3906 RepID=A0AAV1B1T3_VICFA|nr:unnamed protein product [Vicia faba]
MTIEEPTADDIDVTPLVDTKVIALASKELFVHIDDGFPGELSDSSVLTGYADHINFTLFVIGPSSDEGIHPLDEAEEVLTCQDAKGGEGDC